MRNPVCTVCGATPVRTYTLARGSVTRLLALCPGHAEPLETLIRLTSTKTRSSGSVLVSIEDLKPSRAMLARAQTAGSERKGPPKGPGRPNGVLPES